MKELDRPERSLSHLEAHNERLVAELSRVLPAEGRYHASTWGFRDACSLDRNPDYLRHRCDLLWAIDKFVKDGRLASLLKLLVVLICLAAILQRILPLAGIGWL